MSQNENYLKKSDQPYDRLQKLAFPDLEQANHDAE